MLLISFSLFPSSIIFFFLSSSSSSLCKNIISYHHYNHLTNHHYYYHHQSINHRLRYFLIFNYYFASFQHINNFSCLINSASFSTCFISFLIAFITSTSSCIDSTCEQNYFYILIAFFVSFSLALVLGEYKMHEIFL